jgi:hypothetical protein
VPSLPLRRPLRRRHRQLLLLPPAATGRGAFLDLSRHGAGAGLGARRPAAAALPLGAIQLLSGGNAGKEMELTKTLTTLGKPGVQVAVIARRPHGYFITHVEGASFPVVNGKTLDAQAHQLADHDVIELAGIKMEFFLKADSEGGRIPGDLLKQYLPRYVLGLVILLVLLGHSARIYQIPFINHMDALIYDVKVRPDHAARGMDERVVILDIDEKSLAEQGRWPWGRDKLATLMNKLFDQYGSSWSASTWCLPSRTTVPASSRWSRWRRRN